MLITACAPVKGPAEDGVSAGFKDKASQNFVAGMQPSNVKVTRGEKRLPAACKVTFSKYETASFQAPAKVNLHAYSKDAVNATLTCSFEDETKSVTFESKNLSVAARTGSAIGVILLCPICGLGVAAANAGTDKQNDIYGFTDLKLEF